MITKKNYLLILTGVIIASFVTIYGFHHSNKSILSVQIELASFNSGELGITFFEGFYFTHDHHQILQEVSASDSLQDLNFAPLDSSAIKAFQIDFPNTTTQYKLKNITILYTNGKVDTWNAEKILKKTHAKNCSYRLVNNELIIDSNNPCSISFLPFPHIYYSYYWIIILILLLVILWFYPLLVTTIKKSSALSLALIFFFSVAVISIFLPVKINNFLFASFLLFALYSTLLSFFKNKIIRYNAMITSVFLAFILQCLIILFLDHTMTEKYLILFIPLFIAPLLIFNSIQNETGTLQHFSLIAFFISTIAMLYNIASVGINVHLFENIDMAYYLTNQKSLIDFVSVFSFYNTHISYAAFFHIATLLMAFYLRRNQLVSRYTLIAFDIIVLVFLIFTAVRVFILVWIVINLFFLFDYFSQKLSTVYKVSLLIILIALMIPNPVVTSMMKKIDPLRGHMWDLSMEQIKENPLIGIGVNNTTHLFNEAGIYINENPEAGVYNTAHNQFVHNWLERGFFSSLILIGLFVFLLFYSMKKQNNYLFLFLIATILFLLVETAFERSKGGNYIRYVFFDFCLLNEAKKEINLIFTFPHLITKICFNNVFSGEFNFPSFKVNRDSIRFLPVFHRINN